MELYLILDELATIQDSSRAKAKVLAELAGPAKTVFETFDFAGMSEKISKWFMELIEQEPPPPTIKGIYFGLFESESDDLETDGCELYVSGSNIFDYRDQDWACTNDWWPEGRYADIQELNKLWQDLDRHDEVEAWQVVLAICVIVLNEFIHPHRAHIDKTTGLRDTHFAVGFDDGNLLVIGE